MDSASCSIGLTGGSISSTYRDGVFSCSAKSGGDAGGVGNALDEGGSTGKNTGDRGVLSGRSLPMAPLIELDITGKDCLPRMNFIQLVLVRFTIT